MAMTNIIPEVWAMEMIQLLEKSLAAAQIANRDIAGEINNVGDVLHIIGQSDVTVGNYPASGNITYNETSDTDTELVINIDKYFGLKFEDKAKIQAAFDFQSPYVRRATYKLRDEIDQLLMAEYANAGIVSYATGTTAWQFTYSTCANVPNFFAKIHKELDDAYASRMGRYMIVSPAVLEAFVTYFAQRSTVFGDNIAQNGYIASAMGFDLYLSNNCVTADSKIHCMAGVKGDSIAYAQQINPESIEMLRSEGRFADLVRGRVLAGIKTYRPDTLVDVVINETAIATS